MKIYGGFADFSKSGSYKIYAIECIEDNGQYILDYDVPISNKHYVNTLYKNNLNIPYIISNEYSLDQNYVVYSLNINNVISFFEDDKRSRIRLIQDRLDKIEGMAIKDVVEYKGYL